MILYRFKTFRTSYYFPDRKERMDFLYGLYSAMGGQLSKIYWRWFWHSRLVRHLTRVKDPNKEFPFSKIMQMMPKGSIVSFNLGTPGAEQKISMLGILPNGGHFFAKYSTKPAAVALSRNEIKILSALKHKGLTPELYDYTDGGDYVFFRTSCIEGYNPKNLEFDENILSLVYRVNDVNFANGTLKTCLSHGDFTPWNIVISSEGNYNLIDWEMADIRVLGYDVFTYICQVATLFHKDIQKEIEKKKELLDKYFIHYGVTDWLPYIKEYAKEKIAYEKNKGNSEFVRKLECLL